WRTRARRRNRRKGILPTLNVCDPAQPRDPTDILCSPFRVLCVFRGPLLPGSPLMKEPPKTRSTLK
ncbi:MAG: hypothetical protein KDA89_08920, partial [Planctomycetaceae bacterium]|nr:hypothetical protein [Planctomycetaceae bacterium]